MKFRSLFSLGIILSFFSAGAMDPRMTREIVIDTNNLLDVSLCRPGLITAADVGATGLTITTPGVYLLSENITFSPVGAASAITIASDNVQLNLQCFSINQGNAVLGVNGIEVASGHASTLIENGSIVGFTGDGIVVNDDNAIIFGNNVHVQQCARGIFLNGSMASPISKVFIEGCDLLLNNTGFSGNWVNAGRITNCSALMSTAIGFELLNSISNKFIACKAEDTMTTMSESVYGFFVNGGSKNLFKKLCVDGTTTNATFTGDTATGFYIGPDEDELGLKLSHVSNSITTSNAQAFGIHMDYTFTELNNAGLPEFDNDEIVRSVNWSSDSRYLAIASDDDVIVLEFAGNNLTQIATFTHGGLVVSVDWSPDGQFLAMGGEQVADVAVRVLGFNGSSLSSIATFSHGDTIQPVNWSPDGRYLAVGGEPSAGIDVQVLEFDGSSLTSVATFAHGALVDALNWSPDGKYVAMGGGTSGGVEVEVLEFDGSSLTSVATFAHGLLIASVNWSPDGKYVAIGGNPSGGIEVQVLFFDGVSLTSVATFAHGALIISVNWSPDGRYLAIGGLPSGGIEVQALIFDGNSLSSVASFVHGAIDVTVNWAPNGNFLAIGSGVLAGPEVRILSGFQFPQNCIIEQNNVEGIKGAALPVGQPGVSNGRGLSASSGNNLIIKNTAFNNDINYIFVTDVYRQFLVNVASTVPSLIDNLSFPPL